MGKLNNGAVLPHGLLGISDHAAMGGFNKSYRNFPLRLGVIKEIYPIDDDKNVSGLTTEYDVLVFEQNEDRGATTIIYRNCMSSEGLGSVADYFERTMRKVETKTNKGDSITLQGQNGAVVLLLCLDGMSDKGIIISALTNPDRDTNLVDDQPRLVGEYNGVKVMINPDGSCSLVFNGATDNDGEVIDDSQGPTAINIETDGSFQIMHSTITVRLDKQGVITMTSTDDLNITCKDANITASGNTVTTCTDATITASGTATVEGKTVKLGAGAAEAVIKGDTFKKLVFDPHIHPTPIGPSGPPSIPMDPSSLSKKVITE